MPDERFTQPAYGPDALGKPPFVPPAAAPGAPEPPRPGPKALAVTESAEAVSSSGADQLLGRTLGQYRVLTKLGQGGMGAVFRALDLRLQREVAVKVIHCGPLDDPKTGERFTREALSMARLNHPNLLHIYNVGNEGPWHYFAMEILQGVSLSALIHSRQRLAPEEALPLAGQLLSALHYVHRQGITHRDIKSGNIMVCGARVVLMDFGLAKDEQSTTLTSPGAVMGTPDYMAPEQAEGLPVGPASDLYSVGVVLYEALCGEVPFKGRSALSILRQHLEEQPPPLQLRQPSLDPRLAALIHRCLNKRPEDRYPDAVALAQALAQIYPCPELAQVGAQDHPPAAGPQTRADYYAPTLPGQSFPQAAAAAPLTQPPPLPPDLPSRRPLWLTASLIILALLALSALLLSLRERETAPGLRNEQVTYLGLKRDSRQPNQWRHVVREAGSDKTLELTHAEFMARYGKRELLFEGAQP